MTESFQIKGEWYLPANQETKLNGILTYHPQDGIELELFGGFASEWLYLDQDYQEIILGITNKSKQVTLYGCNVVSSGGATVNLNGEQNGIPTVTYSINQLFIGMNCLSVEELVFDNISAEIFNLNDWLGISGFNIDLNPEKFAKRQISVHYTLPENIDFQIDPNTKGSFGYSVNDFTMQRLQKNISITQRVQFIVKTSENHHVSKLLEYIIGFQNFLTMAMYKSPFPLKVLLRSDNFKVEYRDGATQHKVIELFFSSRNLRSDERLKSDFEMLFNYQIIESDFPNIIQNWFKKYEILAPAFDLVFEQFYSDGLFSVNTFLNLAQAAETFHARMHDHTKIPKDQYKIMRENILSSTPKEYHPWLKDQFNFGNHLNLHLRLTELIEKYSNSALDKIIGDKEKFVLNVKYSRNYYTHYSSSSKKHALEGSELFYLSEKLKALLVCAFLIESGINSELLEKLVDRVKNKLFRHILMFS